MTRATLHAAFAGAAFDLLGFVMADLNLYDETHRRSMLTALQRWASVRGLEMQNADPEHWQDLLQLSK